MAPRRDLAYRYFIKALLLAQLFQAVRDQMLCFQSFSHFSVSAIIMCSVMYLVMYSVIHPVHPDAIKNMYYSIEKYDRIQGVRQKID